MITAILTAIAQAEKLLDHLWQSFNSTAMVTNKVAQLSQDNQDKYRVLIQQSMTGDPASRAAALQQVRDLVAE